MVLSQKTGDGSLTLFSEKFQETYHSRHGAKTESLHVFIQNGFKALNPDLETNRIGEIGLGTGLNAILSLEEGQRRGKRIQYFSLEAFPISPSLILEVVNAYPEFLPDLYLKILNAPENEKTKITPDFEFTWYQKSWPAENPFSDLDLMYYDAFAPGTQPELWTEDAFHQAFKVLKPGGVLVTYCAKGYVKRNLKSVGFEVETLPGPPRKREMTRAVKPV
jgi:tRNA U34 5-methylaminomethyl-2-thiouridine-forming methyltransferase MnmC